MGLCMECGANIRDDTKCCPACRNRHLSGVHGNDTGIVEMAVPIAGMQPEMMFAQVHLKLRGVEFVEAPPRTHALALSVFVLGAVSLFVGLLGQGWFGIPAVIHGHRVRRRIAESRGAKGGSGMALAGLSLGYVALGLTVVHVLLKS